jgi:adenosylhomocysteine nucleosidase
MGVLAFLCAMPMELRPLSRRLDLSRSSVGGLRTRSGRLDGRPVVAVAVGMGTMRSSRATERLLDATEVDRVLVFGITGAVDDDIAIGTVVSPALVVDGETGVEHVPDRLVGPDPEGTMWTTNRITRADELPELRRRGVVCLDMETAAVAASCERRAIPWSVHRAVSDRATDGSVDDEVLHLSNADGTPNPRAVARYVVRHPGRLPGLVTVAKGARLATERAADAAIAAARALLDPDRDG